MNTETMTTRWESLSDEARDHQRKGHELAKRADEMHCGFRLNGDARCMYDAGHEGDHRLNEWAWMAPPA